MRKETTPTRVNIKKSNDAQRIAYNIVQDHFISENKEPLLMMITGLGGSGKSFVIQALSQLLHTKCRVCAFFGIAAFNIKGKTLHSLLQLPIKGPLKSSALANFSMILRMLIISSLMNFQLLVKICLAG